MTKPWFKGTVETERQPEFDTLKDTVHHTARRPVRALGRIAPFIYGVLLLYSFDQIMNADLNNARFVRLPFSVGVSFSVRPNSVVEFDPRSHAAFSSFRSVYPSVGVLSANATLAVAPSADGYVSVAWHPSDAVPTTVEGNGFSPHFSHTFLATEARPNLVCALPTNHSFGREITAVQLGRGCPTLVIVSHGLPAAADTLGWCHVVFNLEGRVIGSQEPDSDEETKPSASAPDDAPVTPRSTPKQRAKASTGGSD